MSITLLRELIVEILHEKSEVIVYHASPQLDLKLITPRYSPTFKEDGIFVSTSRRAMIDSWTHWALQKPAKDKIHRSDEEPFENVAVYTIRIPRELFNKAKPGISGWDIETFIPADLLDGGGLTPSSVKTYTKQEILDLSRNRNRWKLAGFSTAPKKPAVTGGAKNQARDVYRRLDGERDLAVMKYGGRPYEKKAIDDLFAELLQMTKKPRLNIDEQERLRELDDLITSALAGARVYPRQTTSSDPVKLKRYMYGDQPSRPERVAIRQRSRGRNREDGDE